MKLKKIHPEGWPGNGTGTGDPGGEQRGSSLVTRVAHAEISHKMSPEPPAPARPLPRAGGEINFATRSHLISEKKSLLGKITSF